MEENMVNNMTASFPETEAQVAADNLNPKNWIAALKKTAAGIGWRYFVFTIIVMVAQFGFAFFIGMLMGIFPKAEWLQGSWVQFMTIIIPTYCIAFPLLALLLKKMPKVEIPKKKMSVWKIALAVLMGAGICGIGMVLGTVTETLILLPFGGSSTDANALAELMIGSDAFWRILTVGILAPIVEEFIFRKLLIDRVIKYGEFVAVMLSGLMFGLFHGNFNQFFFATGLGMLYAFIYARTGKVWYTIILHAVVNLTSSVVTVALASKVLSNIDVVNKISELASTDFNAYMEYAMQPEVSGIIMWLAVYGLWMMFLALCALAGIILMIVFRKKFKLKSTEVPMKKGKLFANSFFNWGMILFILGCMSIFVINYVSVILQNLMV